MGYFPNGTDGEMYCEQYCDNCVHNLEEHGCPILALHWLYNYDECNKPDSILHEAIPRDDKGYNKQCIFYQEQPKTKP